MTIKVRAVPRIPSKVPAASEAEALESSLNLASPNEGRLVQLLAAQCEVSFLLAVFEDDD